MATASNIDDLLQCPICLDIFHDPKVLDCQHTFCSNCLKVHVAATSSNATSVECPVCRQRSHLINHTVDSLPGNYIVRDIIERQYGTNVPQRSAGYSRQIQDRIEQMRQGKQEKPEDDTDYLQYLKPAAAAVVGVLGGLLLAKGVKKLADHPKKSGER